MRIGYVRIGRNEENADMQLAELKPFAIEKVFEDRASGRDGGKGLQLLLNFVRAGDAVYTESIGRLARDTHEFLALVEQLARKKVNLICLKEKIDTAGAEGRYLLSVFEALIQLEQNAARERRQEGIDAALARNKPYGRPKIEINDTFVAVYKRWKAGEITAVQAMQASGLKKNTFYNRVKEFEQAVSTKKSGWGIRIN